MPGSDIIADRVEGIEPLILYFLRFAAVVSPPADNGPGRNFRQQDHLILQVAALTAFNNAARRLLLDLFVPRQVLLPLGRCTG